MNKTVTPRRVHLDFLDIIRTYELDMVVQYLRANERNGNPCRLLELGAGAGIQSRRLFELGYEVSALEVESSSYRNVRCFDILEYDGRHVPLPNQSHDVVFSSHVLEHVVYLEEVLRETYRVLVDDGTCIHVIPTPLCRTWTLFAHFIWLIRRVVKKLTVLGRSAATGEDIPRTPPTARAWLWTLFPPKHGERGNTITEVYYYSRRFWCRKFEETGFDVVHIEPSRLFYSMANSLGSTLSLRVRRHLSRLLGSSCYIYILKKKDLQ